MAITKLALSSALAALASGAAIAAAPFAAAANIDSGPVVAGPTASGAATHAAPTPTGSVSGPVALPPGGPAAVLPRLRWAVARIRTCRTAPIPSCHSASGRRSTRKSGCTV